MSASKQKGTAFETAVVRFLRDSGFPYAERAPLAGNKDRGDITGTPGLVWECKNAKTHRLGEWIDETQIEADNANADHGILIVKRPRHGSAGDAFAIMPLDGMVALLKAAGY